MNIKIPYGYDDVDVSVDDGVRLEIVEPNETTVGDAEAIIEAALASPIDSSSLATFVAGSNDTWVIVNDGTRPTPTAKVLALIYPYIKHTHVKENMIPIMILTEAWYPL